MVVVRRLQDAGQDLDCVVRIGSLMRFGSRMVGVLSGHGLDREEEGRSGRLLEGNLDQ